jgi:hypothetical protein
MSEIPPGQIDAQPSSHHHIPVGEIMHRRTLFCVTGILLWTGLATAQPRPGYSPTSTHVFPAGARRGTTVAVRVGAECIPPGTEFQVHGSGIRAIKRLTKEVQSPGEPSPKRAPATVPITYPRDWASQIKVPKDIPVGPVYWRLHCAQGGTSSRPFIIGDLAEYIENESNTAFSNAERLELPVTVNGQIHGERDVDHFRFKVEAGQSVTCEVVAARLGSKLDAVVALLDKTGRQVNASEYFIGNDPVLVFRAPTTAEYTLRISNVTHRGDPSFVYRVNIRPTPFLRAIFPGGGQPGEKLEAVALTLAGNNRSFMETVEVALPTKHSTSGTWSLPVDDFGAVPVSVDLHRSIDVLNHSSANPNAERRAVNFPSTLYGQFANKEDADEFDVPLKKGERIRVECEAWPPGSPAYPVVELKSSAGKRLAQASSVNATDRIAAVTYTAKKDEIVQLRILDLRYGSQGAVDFTYRAKVESDTPDFELSVLADSLTAVQGQDSALTINVKRKGNLDLPITLEFLQPYVTDKNKANQLPDGVTVSGDKSQTFEIPKGKANARLKLTVSADARTASYPLQIVGRCTVDGKEMRRIARFRHLGADSEGVSVGSPDTELFHLSVQHKPLFKVECSEHYQYAYRGSVYPYEMEVERLEGFDGPIYLQRGDRQNRDMDGVEIWNATLEPGKSKIIVPIYLPETMAINVQSQTQLYSQAWTKFKDKHGQEQSMLILSNKRNMLRSLPPVVKLRSIDKTIVAKPGESTTCRLLLKRTSNFPGPLTLRLLDEQALKAIGIQIANQDVIAAGQTEVSIQINVAKNYDASQPRTIKFRAEGELDKFKIITESATILTSETSDD